MRLNPTAALTAMLLVLAAPSLARADIEPTFNLEPLVWSAEQVVTVTEGAAIDGVVTVVASLKGTLAPGTELRIPALAAFAPPAARAVTCIAAAPAACPARVDGQRMVLFLRGPTQGEWRPAAEYGGFRVSVAWLEGGRAYAVQQFSNPGPQQLLPAGDEGAFLGTVSSVLALQQALDHALALPTPVARVAALRPIAASTSYDQGPALARHHAVQALARQGAAAFPTLRALVEAPAILPFVDELVMAMARADGAASVPVLVALLDEGVRYWRVQAPTLPVAWWNDLSLGSARITELRARYSVLITALRSLQSLHDPRAAGAVRALRGFWQSQLGVHDDHRQMIETCDATLGALR